MRIPIIVEADFIPGLRVYNVQMLLGDMGAGR